jgi:CubicO group peptidase (beta-lactamase class C family)
MTLTKLTLAAQAAGFLLSFAATQAGAQTPKLDAAIAAANAVVETAINDGQIPGAEIVIAVDGKIIQDRAFGYAQINDFNMRRLPAPRPLHTTTVFDLASVTKVMATTMALMLLVDQGKVSVDAPVYTYLPDFRGPELDKITVRHLLTHTAGLVQWQPLYYSGSTKTEVYRAIRVLPLKWAVGESYHYSDLGFMLLGYIAEHASGQPLDQFLDRALYQPLGLRSTAFLPKAKGFTDFAATESGNGYERHMIYGPDFGYGYAGDPASWNGWRQYVFAGEVDDGNAWHGNGGVAGHAGLFSTGADLQVLLDMLLNQGAHQGKRHIRAETVALFLKPDAHLGWVQPQGLPPGSFSHTGFTGTYVLGIPEAKLAFVLLANRQNMGANAEGYFPDLGPLQAAAVRPLLDALLPKK